MFYKYIYMDLTNCQLKKNGEEVGRQVRKKLFFFSLSLSLSLSLLIIKHFYNNCFCYYPSIVHLLLLLFFGLFICIVYLATQIYILYLYIHIVYMLLLMEN